MANLNIGINDEAIAKLISVVADGLGGLFGPWQMERVAKAEAKVARIRTEAREELRLLTASYQEAIEVAVEAQEDPPMLPARAHRRIDAREARRQTNLEVVVAGAAEECRGKRVDDAAVDPDWVSRLFASVQDVSNEDMQTLWSRVLAGEVVQPGSFSLRTLEVLRNLSPDEASSFAKLAALSTEPEGAIPSPGNVLTTVGGWRAADVFGLQDAQLVDSEPRQLSVTADANEPNMVLSFHTHLAVIPKLKADDEIVMPALRLSSAGRELAQIAAVETNVDYVRAVLLAIPGERERFLARRYQNPLVLEPVR